MVESKHQDFMFITRSFDRQFQPRQRNEVHKEYIPQRFFLSFVNNLQTNHAHEIHFTLTPNYIIIPCNQAQETLYIMQQFLREQWELVEPEDRRQRRQLSPLRQMRQRVLFP
jgi:hypothetical protein